jgi:molecular chaperone DnaK
MVSDAQLHAEEDRKRREEIEARNRLDSLVYSTEKTLNENREKLDTSEAATFEAALADAKKALEAGTSAEAMTEAGQRLQDVSHRLAEAIYKGSASAGPGGGSPPPGSGGERAQGSGAKEEEVIDTEYVDTDKS